MIFFQVFEFKKGDDRKVLDEAMNLLLPLVQQIMVGLMASECKQNVLMMQRLVLKIFYTLTHHHLPLALLGQKVCDRLVAFFLLFTFVKVYNFILRFRGNGYVSKSGWKLFAKSSIALIQNLKRNQWMKRIAMS